MSVPATVSFWIDVLFSLTVVTEFSFGVVPLVDFCFVLLLLLGVAEITSEVSKFCSTTTEAAPFLFEGTSDGLTFSTVDAPSLSVEKNQHPAKLHLAHSIDVDAKMYQLAIFWLPSTYSTIPGEKLKIILY
jgi:hypothetical protein